MKLITLIWICAAAFGFLVLFSAPLRAQSDSELEKKFFSVQAKLHLGYSALDSLKNLLDYRASLIDAEKQKYPQDNNKISGLMSGSMNISNNIESWQRKIDRLEKEIEAVNNKLYIIYTRQLDSLSQALASGKISGLNEELKMQTISEKKLLVSPKIYLLKVNPQKLIGLDVSKIGTKQEKEIYSEYVKTAIDDVTRELAIVNESFNETGRMLTLKKKAKRFSDESDLDGRPLSYRMKSPGESDTRAGYGDTKGTAAAGGLNSRYASFSKVLMQFDIHGEGQPKNEFSPKNKNIDLKEYKGLLNELKKRLQDYKSVLTSKARQLNEK